MWVWQIPTCLLSLSSCVSVISAAIGLVTRVNDVYYLDETVNPYKYSGTVAASARIEDDFGPLAESDDWELKEPDPSQWVWTDDYSNIVGSVLRKLKD